MPQVVTRPFQPKKHSPKRFKRGIECAWSVTNSKLEIDAEFVRLCCVLFQLHPDTRITCQGSTLIYKCLGLDRHSSCPHNSVVIVREYSGQSNVCRRCQQQESNDKVSELTRQRNWKSQTAPNSKTNWENLTDEQAKKRRRNQAVRNQRQNRTVARLMKQISEKDEPMCIAASEPEGEDFTATTKRAALNGISEKFKDNSREMM